MEHIASNRARLAFPSPSRSHRLIASSPHPLTPSSPSSPHSGRPRVTPSRPLRSRSEWEVVRFRPLPGWACPESPATFQSPDSSPLSFPALRPFRASGLQALGGELDWPPVSMVASRHPLRSIHHPVARLGSAPAGLCLVAIGGGWRGCSEGLLMARSWWREEGRGEGEGKGVGCERC
jgi:hypothetical protein